MASAPTATGNKHQQRTEATRRKLLKSAQRVFARDGFEAARIEDIANDAGHTRGAFYANFESKEDLFFALLEQQAGERFAKMERVLERCSTDEERVAAFRTYYVGLLSDRQWSMLMLEFKLFALRHNQLRPKLVKTHRRIRASLKASKIKYLHLLGADSDCSLHSEEAVRRVLEATLHALVLEHAYDPQTLSEAQAAQSLKQIFDLLIQLPPKK